MKRKRGMLLADLAQPGDEILVARGGQGGVRNLLLIEWNVENCNLGLRFGVHFVDFTAD